MILLALLGFGAALYAGQLVDQFAPEAIDLSEVPTS